MRVGVGYRSGISLLPALTPKRLKQKEPGLGLMQTSNPGVLSVYLSLFLNSQILFSAVYLTERFDYAACFILGSFFININLF